MELVKKILGFLTFGVALVFAFYLVTAITPIEFVQKMVAEEWYLKGAEYVAEWGLTALLVLGMSRMLAINNKVAMVFTFVLWVALSAVVVLSLNFYEEYIELLDKVGLFK